MYGDAGASRWMRYLDSASLSAPQETSTVDAAITPLVFDAVVGVGILVLALVSGVYWCWLCRYWGLFPLPLMRRHTLGFRRVGGCMELDTHSLLLGLSQTMPEGARTTDGVQVDTRKK